MLMWAREHDCPWNNLVLSNAASGGHTEVMRWAKENGCPGG
jgi:hypothetical protein